MTHALLELWLAPRPGEEGGRSARHGTGGTGGTGNVSDDETSVMLSEDDAVLVARLHAGDERAFRAVWDAYHGRLIEFAYRYLQSRDAAADAVQHLFFTLWQTRATFAPKHGISSHLYGAVRFRVLRELRHARVERRYEARYADGARAGDVAMAENAGADAVESAELDATVRGILETMTPRVREIFLMSRADGLSAAQIGEVLGISVPVVYNQLSKALKLLAAGIRGVM